MKKIRALVIDDEQVVLDSVKRILAEENYEVDVTLSGRQGIEMAIKNNYNIVLTDIRMPEVDGLIVLRDIKRQKPALPVSIITGYGSIRSAVQAMKLGASDYIEKPFTPDDLVRSIKDSIEKAEKHEPEPQAVVHKEEMIRVLELAASDDLFRHNLLEHGADALDDFELSRPEKLAVITGDIHWIEEELGPLTPNQRQWLEARLEAEVW
ncbi:MAG: response regulator [Desulfobacteraceae bacterium]|nr:MAG: response regulator [Desulfobacteraceae bacterium]